MNQKKMAQEGPTKGVAPVSADANNYKWSINLHEQNGKAVIDWDASWVPEKMYAALYDGPPPESPVYLLAPIPPCVWQKKVENSKASEKTNMDWGSNWSAALFVVAYDKSKSSYRYVVKTGTTKPD